MKAFAIDSYKSTLRAVNVPEPVVGESDVLVRVEAASVNQLDVKIAHGEFKQILPYATPLILGHDVAGTVIDVGSKVRGFASGDQIYARPRDGRIGTFAEHIAIAEEDVALKPATLTMTEAASLPLVALTAWQALVEIGNVGPGDKVLVHAGAGGVGTITIQLAKHLGAYVATTASAAQTEFLRGLGADEVIDYRTQDFTEKLSNYDLVLDSLGAESVARSLTVLKPGGTVVGISGPPTPDFAREAKLNPLLRLGIAVLSRRVRTRARRLGVKYRFLFMKANGQQLHRISELVDAGALTPVVGETFPFDQTPSAFEALVNGLGGGGKAVITGGTTQATPEELV